MTAEELTPKVASISLDETANGEALGQPQAGSTESQPAGKATVEPAEAIPKQPNKTTFPPHKYHLPEISLVNRHADEPRRLRVVVIGAGLSGITAGVLLPVKAPGIDLTIFEKNSGVSGTWFENRYPNVRCDIPAHVYQSSFSPNTQWTEEFAQGAEIREYWEGIARKYDVYKYLRLSQKVEGLKWNANKSVWIVTVRDLTKEGPDSIYTHEADFVLPAIGRFNDWRLPDYPGLADFKGHLRHTSNWDTTYDINGKRIAVIGNGASGIQVVANIQKRVAHLDHYARNKTWIAASFSGDATSTEPILIPEEKKERFKRDPEAYLAFRKEMESKYWRGFDSWLRNSETNTTSQEEFIKLMEQRLGSRRPDLVKDLIPDFSPHCRRLTPGPGYFEAITADNTDYIQTPIRRFTETGIETVDGQHREVDAILCATGANVDSLPPFSIEAHGRDLRRVWAADGEYGFPYTYLGLATPGFPNLLFVHGPNGSGRSGTVPHNVEVQVTLYAQILRKAAREGIRTMQPSRAATDDFVQYSDAFWKTTVLTENCSSWYNSGTPGARIHGLWPGSAALVTILSRNPRWEDWEYEYLSESGNRLAWYFGNGSTLAEKDLDRDITTYLRDPAKVDLRDIHESWWNIP